MVDPAVVWPMEHEDALRALVAENAGSHSVIAGLLNERFGTFYSRNAVCGKTHRMGLSVEGAAKPAKAVREKRAVSHRPQIVKPKPTAVEIAVFRCAEVEPKNVALVDLSKNGCRWPYGDGPFFFCGHAKFGDYPYCGPHVALSVRTPMEEA